MKRILFEHRMGKSWKSVKKVLKAKCNPFLRIFYSILSFPRFYKLANVWCLTPKHYTAVIHFGHQVEMSKYTIQDEIKRFVWHGIFDVWQRGFTFFNLFSVETWEKKSGRRMNKLWSISMNWIKINIKKIFFFMF